MAQPNPRRRRRASSRSLHVAATTVALTGLIVASSPVFAQDASTDLNRQIQQRDAVIRDLTRRIEALERQAAPAAPQPTPAPAAAPPAEPAAPPPAGGESKPAPGAIEVDEQAAERALERTLVAGGALLLPAGQAEIEPAFNYIRRENNDIPVLVDVGGGDLVLANQKVERNELKPLLGFRAGLPWDTQLELSLPYNLTQQDEILDLGAAGRETRDGWGHGLGDLTVGLAKTVLREGVVRPDLVARVTYNTGFGDKEDNGITLDGGYSSVTGSLVALKRQDPLAFVVSGFYQKSFDEDNVNLGDQYGFSLGTLLAASPETSLRFQLQTTFVDDIEVDGTTINDSNQVQGVLIVGASSILGRGVLLDVSGGIGLTNDAPDYFISISLPIRFNLPVL
jgi:hypothetical protein